MKAVVAAFNQEKALVGAFSVITNLRMQFGWNFEALSTQQPHLELAAVELDTLDRVRDGVDGGPRAGRTVSEGRHGG